MGDREKLAQSYLDRTFSRRTVLKAGVAVPFGAALLSATARRAYAQDATDFSGTTIRVWSGGTVAAPAEAAAAQWSELTGGTVSVEVVPFGERPLKFAGLVAAQDSSIDLLYISGQFAAQFGDRLYDDLEDPALEVDSGAFVPAIIPILSSDGALRGLPVHSEMEIYIYNKAMFAAAGLDPESPPDTWEGLYAAAPAFAEQGVSGCAVPWSSIYAAGYYVAILNSIPGARLISEDRTEVQFGDENGLRAFETLEAGFKAGFFHPELAPDVEDYATGKMFNAGETASMMNFAELWGYATGATPPDETWMLSIAPEDVGATIVPGINGGESGSINGFEGFGLNRFGAQKEAALDFLKFLTGQPFQKEMNLGKTLPSSRTDVLTDPEVQAAYPVGEVLDAQGAFNLDRYGAPYDWTPPVNSALLKLYNGEVTAAQAHEEAVTGVANVIALWQVS